MKRNGVMWLVVASSWLVGVSSGRAAADCTDPQLAWHAVVQSLVEGYEPTTQDIAAGPGGEVFVVGSFLFTVDFDPTAGVDTHTAMPAPVNNTSDFFLTRLESDGAYGWTVTDGGWDEDDGALAVSVDPAGFVVMAGFYRVFLFIGNDFYVSNGGADAFVAKFDFNGQPVWARSFGGVGDDEAKAVAVDAADGGVLVGLADGSLIKLNNVGDQLWNVVFASSIRSVAVDQVSNILVANGYRVSKLTGLGSEVWSRTVQSGVVTSLATDAVGNVFLLANSTLYKLAPDVAELWQQAVPDSSSTIAVDTTSGSTFVMADFNLPDSQVIKIAADGQAVWTEVVPVHTPRSLDVSEDGNVVATDLSNSPFAAKLYCNFPPDDLDGDGVQDEIDNCPTQYNPNGQTNDADADGIGDACDNCPAGLADDADGDNVCDQSDNCQNTPNADQSDYDGNGVGDACDDADGDGILDDVDPCPGDPMNDADGDSLCGDVDDCPSIPNPEQDDEDLDAVGDLCDPCPNDPVNDPDADGLCATEDNCPTVANPNQEDFDADGIGDSCDACPGFNRLYWVDSLQNAVLEADMPTGGCPTPLVTGPSGGLNGPTSVAVDASSGKLYWVDTVTDRIQRSNLDGSVIEDLVTAGLGIPQAIAIDPAGAKMYWTDWGTDKVQRADLDGTDVEDLLTGLGNPYGITLDVDAGKLYWTETNFVNGAIKRANLDGSRPETLLTDLPAATGIALDVAAGKMYWVNWGDTRLQRANLNGSGLETVLTGGQFTDGIALSSDRIYWSDAGDGKIQRSNLDGTGKEDVLTSLSEPRGIAIVEFGSASVAGDCDGSGAVELLDLTCFVSALLGVDTDPPGGIARSDVNADGATNGGDVQTFVEMLVLP